MAESDVFPSERAPLVVPQWLLDSIRADRDPRLNGARRRLEEGAIVAPRDPRRERAGVTPGGIRWRGYW